MISKQSLAAASWPRRNQARAWPSGATRFAPLACLLLVVTIFSLHANADTRSLAEVAEYLRDGDYRLVRPSPSDSTMERQHSEACEADLQRAYKVLTTEKKDSKALVDAAEVVSLCTTNNPKNRAKLTTVKGVPEALVAMLKRDPASTAAAAECIWISSFNSPENYKAFTKAGAVDALAQVLTSIEPCTDKSCYHAEMWSAAALQNLAATYCEGGHGYCDWEWATGDNGDGSEVAYEVVLSKSSTPKEDPSPVREQLLKNNALIDALSKGICGQVKDMEEHPTERTWPSRAKVPNDINTPHIVPWAYMGLVKNLAFAKGSFEKFSEQTIDCICDYAVQSPDWLEFGKAQDALWNFGWDYQEFCEPLYNDDECQNYEDFQDDDGNGCEVYEEERWCAEYGNSLNSNGVTADEACCACGGGQELVDEL